MKSGLIALNPHSGESPSLKNLCLQIKDMQERGLLQRIEVVSLIHPNFFPFPPSSYKEMKEQVLSDVRTSLEKGINGCFKYEKLDILEASESNNDDLVTTLSQIALKRRMQILILGLDTSDNGYRWLFGGVSQTAALSSGGPTLILKVHESPTPLSAEPAVLLAVDTLVPPSIKAVKRLHRIFKPLNARLHLLHVKRKTGLLSAFSNDNQKFETIEEILRKSKKDFSDLGFECDYEILEENKSIAHTIAEYARIKQVWMTTVTSPSRGLRHRVLWGSTTQNLLAQNPGPVLVLRTN